VNYREGFDRALGELVGVLSIRLPLARYEAAAATRFQSRLVRDLASFTVVFLVLGFLMERYVIRRLAELQAAAKRLARGAGESIPIQGGDELDDLAVSFNQMAREVSSRQQALEASKREIELHCELLEERVAHRTNDLAKAVECANGANRAKTAFLASMSHELRTPLNAVLGFTDVVLTGQPGPLNDEQRKQLAIVRQSGQQLLDIVAEALDLARIESGALQVDCHPVGLAPLLAEQCSPMQLQADERGLVLVGPDCDPSIVVIADPKRLGQVVRNLLSNAIKFTDHGSVRLAVVAEGNEARVEVVDSGVGIPPDQHHRLFQSFQRIQGRAGGNRPGTGLGLVISKRIVEAMGGTIGFHSEPGLGSRFWFTVPLGRDVARSAGHEVN
jgi:signal transduction histidine kinase